jgi:hypothetical protein
MLIQPSITHQTNGEVEKTPAVLHISKALCFIGAKVRKLEVLVFLFLIDERSLSWEVRMHQLFRPGV